MAQRRKIEFPITDYEGDKPDVDLGFQNAANEVSKLYHQALNLQKVSFDAGRKNSLTKAYEWVQSQIQEGKLVSSAEFMAYVQNELNDSLPTIFGNMQLETSSQRSGSNHSQTSREAQMEANSASCGSAASSETRQADENVDASQDQAMDEDPPQV